MRAKSKRITIQQQTDARDESGQPLDNWIDVATDIFASIEPISGKEFFAAQQVNSEATARIWINYRTGILPKMRVVYGTRKFEIIGPPIDFEDRHIELQLICKELI